MKKSDFFLRIIEYLSEGKALREVYTSTDYELQYRITKFLNDTEDREYADVMEDIIDFLQSLGYLSDVRYRQLCMIRKETERLTDIHESDIFQFLFMGMENTPFSDVVGKLLYDHYGEIVCQMLVDHKKGSNNGAPLQKESLLLILSDFVLHGITACNISAIKDGEEIWTYIGTPESVLDKDIDTETEDTEDSYLTDLRFVNCYIVTVYTEKSELFSDDDRVINISKNLINDDDVSMGDLVTFVKADSSQAVTFQVITYSRLETDSESVDAYKARRMPYPILSAEDLDQYT